MVSEVVVSVVKRHVYMLFGSRPVDRRRARQIQTRKREDLSGACVM